MHLVRSGAKCSETVFFSIRRGHFVSKMAVGMEHPGCSGMGSPLAAAARKLHIVNLSVFRIIAYILSSVGCNCHNPAQIAPRSLQRPSV